MTKDKEGFIGIDVAKACDAIEIAEAGREEEVRFLGEVDAMPVGIRRAINQIAASFEHLHFCYEAGSSDCGLYRQKRLPSRDCTVVAPLDLAQRRMTRSRRTP